MATKQIGPIQFQGKLDNLVGRSTRKGYMSIGMKAKKTTNPNTPKQVRARTEFACAQNYGNSIPAACLAGLRPYSRGIKASIRNAAAKLCYMVDVMITDTNTEGGYNCRIPEQNFFFSKGTQPNVIADNDDLSNDVPSTVKVVWDNTPVEDYNALCHVILYQAEEKVFLHQIVPAREKTATFKVAQRWTGAKVQAYIYTQYLPTDPDGIKYATDFPSATSEEREAIESRSTYSPTRYIGSTTVG